MAKINIIPTPKGWWTNGASFVVEQAICGDFAAEINTFTELAFACGYTFTVGEGGVVCKKDECLCEDEYKLMAKDEKVVITAGGAEGAAYALATLLQLLSLHDGKAVCQAVTVTDKPDCSYRGLLIDCARSLHPLPLMKKYIDMCWLYKVKYLHIHFSDDEGYTLPSKAFPKLSTEGKCFTFEEIAELNAYALSRNIQLVPEVDTPGHTTEMQKKYPEIFGVQGILKFTKAALEGTAAIYREICELFPNSEYIHIGGDEGRLGWWLDDKECQDYGMQFGYNPDDTNGSMSSNEWLMLRYLAHYIAENAKVITSCGKKPIVWEGFHRATNEMIPKDVTVMVFDSSYQIAPHLAKDGFKVINCSWLPTYVVTPIWYYSEKECFDWDIHSYGTINEGSQYCGGMMHLPDNDLYIGGQLSSWGDVIEKSFETPAMGRSDEFEKIRRRLPFISENTWNREKRTDFDGATEALNVADKIMGLISK